MTFQLQKLSVFSVRGQFISCPGMLKINWFHLLFPCECKYQFPGLVYLADNNGSTNQQKDIFFCPRGKPDRFLSFGVQGDWNETEQYLGNYLFLRNWQIPAKKWFCYIFFSQLYQLSNTDIFSLPLWFLWFSILKCFACSLVVLKNKHKKSNLRFC